MYCREKPPRTDILWIYANDKFYLLLYMDNER